nr:Protein IDA [Ipomoea batatas]GMD19828.1 Protein IDA [Ipomoea batatas]
MANSSSFSPSKTIRSPWLIIGAFLLISQLFLLNSTMAARPTMEEDEGNNYAMLSSEMLIKNDPLKHATMLSPPVKPAKSEEEANNYVGMVFQKLPKGVIVPPPGPSKRHNH